MCPFGHLHLEVALPVLVVAAVDGNEHRFLACEQMVGAGYKAHGDTKLARLTTKAATCPFAAQSSTAHQVTIALPTFTRGWWPGGHSSWHGWVGPPGYHISVQ